MSFTIESGENLDYARVQWHGDIEGMEHGDIWGADQNRLGEAVNFLKEHIGDDGCMTVTAALEFRQAKAVANA